MDKISTRTVARMRALRERQGISAAALAERLTGLGIPTTSVKISNIEQGRTALRVDDVWSIAAALDVSPWVLLATHPSDDPVAIGERAASPTDLMPWESGATALFGSGDATAREASDAFGKRLLPAAMTMWRDLAEAWNARQVAANLGDSAREAVERDIEAKIEAAAMTWADDTTETWSEWLSTRRDDRWIEERLAAMTDDQRQELRDRMHNAGRMIQQAWLNERSEKHENRSKK